MPGARAARGEGRAAAQAGGGQGGGRGAEREAMAALGGFAAINLGVGGGGAGGGAERAWAREAAESGLRRRVQAALALARQPAGGAGAVREALEELLEDPDLRGVSGEHGGSAAGEHAAGGVILQLRFVVLRNLARVLETEAEGPARAEGREAEVLRRALECYLEASGLDDKDVVLFHRMSRIALKLRRISTARFSLGQGLALSPEHPLLLERMVEVCFLLGDCDSLIAAAEKLVTVDRMHGAANVILDSASCMGFPEKEFQPEEFLDAVRGAVTPLLTKEIQGPPGGSSRLEGSQGVEIKKVLTLEANTLESLAKTLHAEVQADDLIVQGAGSESLKIITIEAAPTPMDAETRGPGLSEARVKEGCGTALVTPSKLAATHQGGSPAAEAGGTDARELAASVGPGSQVNKDKGKRAPEEVSGAKEPRAKKRKATGTKGEETVGKKDAAKNEKKEEGSKRRSRRVKDLQEKEKEVMQEQALVLAVEAVESEELDTAEEERDPQAVAAELQRYQMRNAAVDEAGAVDKENGTSQTAGKARVNLDEESLVESLLQTMPSGTSAHGATFVFLNSIMENLSRDFVAAALQNSALEGGLLDLASAVHAWDTMNHLSCLCMAEVCMDSIAHMCHKTTKRQRRLQGLPAKTDFSGDISAVKKYLVGYEMGRVSSLSTPAEEPAERQEQYVLLRYNWLRGNLADFEGARELAATFFKSSEDAIRALAGEEDEQKWSLDLPWCRHNGIVSLKAIDSKMKHHVRYDALAKATRLLQSNARGEAIEELVPLVLGEGTSLSNCKFGKHFMVPQTDPEELKALQVLFMTLDDQHEDLRSGRPPEIEMCCSVKMFYTFVPRNQIQWAEMPLARKKSLKSSLRGFSKYFQALLPTGRLSSESVSALLSDLFPKLCNLVQWSYVKTEKGKASNLSLKMQEKSISRVIFYDSLQSVNLLQEANEAACGLSFGVEMSLLDFERSKVMVVIQQAVRLITYTHGLLSDVGYCCSEGVQILKHNFSRLKTFRFLLLSPGIGLGHNESGALRSESTPKKAEFCNTLKKIEKEMRQIFFCLTGFRWGSERLRLLEDCGSMQVDTAEESLEIWSIAKPFIDSLSLDDLEPHVKFLKFIAGAAGPRALERSQGRNIYKLLDDDCMWEHEWSEGTLDLSKYGLQEISQKNHVKSTQAAGRQADGIDSLFWTLVLAEGKVRSGLSLSNCQYEPGRILKQEGQAEVLEEAGLYLSDLHLNPCRFDAWYELSRIYDDAKDLLQNDAARSMNVASYAAEGSGIQNLFTTWRRRSRRCLLIARYLAPDDEILGVETYIGLCAYDALQKVPPMFDQHRPDFPDDQSAMNVAFSRKFFGSAAALEPQDWIHPFFLGKVGEKDGSPAEENFAMYAKAISVAPHALEPFYRLHASRAKVLLSHFAEDGTCKLPSVAICSTLSKYSFSVRVRKSAALQLDVCKDASVDDLSLVSASILQDCCDALSFCLDVQKHYYPPRYMLARLFLACGRVEDALEVLAFCFRGRWGFAINLWEEEGFKIQKVNKSGDKINVGHDWHPGMAPVKVSEIGRDESSRKYIYKLRKLCTMYVRCLSLTGDLKTLQLLIKFIAKHEPWKSCLDDVSLMVQGEILQHIAKGLTKCGLLEIFTPSVSEEGASDSLKVGEASSEDDVLLLKNVFDLCIEMALRSDSTGQTWPSKMQALCDAHRIFHQAPQLKDITVEATLASQHWQPFIIQASIGYVDAVVRKKNFEALEDAIRIFIRNPASFKNLLPLVNKVYAGLVSVSLRHVEALQDRVADVKSDLDEQALRCLRLSFFLYRAAIWMKHVRFQAPPLATEGASPQTTEEVLLLGAFAKVLPREAEKISSLDEVAGRVDAILKENAVPVLALPRGFHFKASVKSRPRAEPMGPEELQEQPLQVVGGVDAAEGGTSGAVPATNGAAATDEHV